MALNFMFPNIYQAGVAVQLAFAKPSPDLNLAVIPYDWGDYAGNIIYNGGPQICFLDPNVVRTLGKPSVRLEPHTVNDLNFAGEVNGKWYPTKPGDRWFAKCWMKTDNSTPAENADVYHGARIGIDFYAPKGDGTICIVDGYPHDGQEHIDGMVRWNTPNWTLRTWNSIIPSTLYTKNLSTGETIPATPITHFVLWMQRMANIDSPGNAWFADAELYLNPTTAH